MPDSDETATTGNNGGQAFFRRQLFLVAGSAFLFTLLTVLGLVLWRTGLEEADKLSSVISMFAGLLGLIITIVTATRLSERRRIEHDKQYWILEGLSEKIQPEDGGLLTLAGIVRLATDRNFEWQYSCSIKGLLEEDWTLLADQLKAIAGVPQLSLIQDLVRSESGVLTFPSELNDSDARRRSAARKLAAAGWLEVRKGNNYRIAGDRFVPLLVVLLATWEEA